MQFNQSGFQTNWGVPIKKSELLKFGGWKSKAKDFIRGAGPTIDLEAAIRTYHDNVNGFCNWFETKQRDVHRDDFAYAHCVAEKLKKWSDGGNVEELQTQAKGVKDHNVSHDEIATAAFNIWEKDGRPTGRDQLHWFMAIEHLRAAQE